MRTLLISGAIALVVSLIGTRFAIRQFTRWGYGQEIREDGPTTHHTKRGTPTMGGVVIIVATVVGYFAATLLTDAPVTSSALLLLFLFVGTGAVGFLDDFIKVVRQRNLGLRSWAKMIGLTVVALAFGIVALLPALENGDGERPASFALSFIRDFGPQLSVVVVLAIIWLLVTGFSNAVNLTDGLDGLAAGVSIFVFGAYVFIGIWQNNQSCSRFDALSHCYTTRDPLDLAIVAAGIAGATFGFLWWNVSPAQIFMGDTGSLALGGALAGLAILTRTEALLLILGGLFVLETLSVILQVGFFKVSKRFGTPRRLFRMAPLHHHFEMRGWEQVTVVIRFWIIAGLFVTAGTGLLYSAWVAAQ